MPITQDNLFDIMSLEDFHATLRPKVSGSWNLHSLLPLSLDFFGMLSSAGGVVGTRVQSNYASGNTYQDSLARYRVSRGQPAIALDLGLVVGVGFAVEYTDALASVMKVGYRGMPEREYLALMDYLCHPQRELPRDPHRAQVVTGIELPRFMRSGHEDEWKGARETYSMQDWMRWVSRPLFRNLSMLTDHSLQSTGDGAAHVNGSANINEVKINFAAEFAAVEYSQVATTNIIMAALKEKLARTLRMPKEDVETQKPIHSYGVDSLVAIDLRCWMGREIKASLSVFEIMAEISLGQPSSLVAERSALLKATERIGC